MRRAELKSVFVNLHAERYFYAFTYRFLTKGRNKRIADKIGSQKC